MVFKPILIDCLKQYNRATFKADLFAGLTVGVVALPLAMAFAIACGLAPEYGLYTAIVAGFLMAACGGSRVQIGGPTGAFVVIIASIYQTYGYGGLVAATLMAGLILILLGVLRMGALIKFVPFPVVTGFTAGIAVVILSTQLKDIFGLTVAELPAAFFPKVAAVVRHLPESNLQAFGLCCGTVGVIVVCRKFFPRLPAMLIGMVAATLVAVLAGLPVETIGSRFDDLPRGLPMPSLSAIDWGNLSPLLMPAITIALLAAIESLLSATVADSMTGDHHRSDTELIGQGIGNIGSALFGGIPATGAIARTATNVRSGGQTPVAGIIHAVTLTVILLLFGAQARLIPLAALAGIMVVVCVNMSEYHVFLHMFRGPKSDWSVMLITFAVTVLFDLVVAVEVGMLLAAAFFVRRMAESAEVKVISSELDYDESKADPDATREKDIPAGVVVFEVQGALFFGAVSRFEELMRNFFRARRARLIVLRLRHVPFIDASGLNVVLHLVRQARKLGVPVVLSGVQPQPFKEFRKYGITAEVGPENVCPDIDEALRRVGVILSGEDGGRS